MYLKSVNACDKRAERGGLRAFIIAYVFLGVLVARSGTYSGASIGGASLLSIMIAYHQ